nr:dual specificity protein phosphatase 23-like [Onthophagus taurus]
MSENGNENINEEVDSYPPWNFSWVVDNKLAAMAWPQNKENLRYIYEEGVRHLVTLSPEKLPPIEQFPQLEWTSIPIEEFGAPTIKDILKFIDVCQKCQQKNQVRLILFLLCFLFTNVVTEMFLFTIFNVPFFYGSKKNLELE